MRAVGAGLVAVLAMVAIYVWNDRQNTGPVEADSGTTEVASPTAVARTDENPGSNQSTTPITNDGASAQTEAVSEEPASQNDPFRVVETTPEDDAPLIENQPESTADNLADNQPEVAPLQTVETTATTSRKVVIPAGGYPVEDSMKYYVPKHERGPGNLGGPPPPAFMVPENADGVRSVESMLPNAPEAPGQ